ncbi:HAD superfamily hydrolase (TIGR01509 family) [Diaminobutyricimonas aerilata]|uniref:HAD superfamily hydrolase (TIGR01509 family) n=1 Tax=Diaminobutyricimonas aerilata TaxID=1162967 RepID=A0A2M9CJT5_9MICO|nr:HAD family phosphatase [Diaminobutyricimonas aerilata]PJJ72165.1 HAD superfamily hydrolase (TIGR01509 family) [Diaminobutyricimonas aerilata]
MTLPAAVLFDMDGTLIDSEPYWFAAEEWIVGEFGGSWDHEKSLELIGQGLWHSARILQSHGVALSEDEIIDRLTTRVLEQVALEVPWRPGALELLREVREAGLPTALVTMSIRRFASRIAEVAGDVFDVIVTGDEVEHSKPHPEAYLTAARLLGVDPAHCVAIEDSPPGLASAVAAGTVAIGVPHIAELAPSSDYTVWPTLAGRTVDDLRELALSGRTS